MSDWNKVIQEWTKKGAPTTHACFCIGPQNGQPLCPCMMRGVQIINGRYVRIEDLGPVAKGASS